MRLNLLIHQASSFSFDLFLPLWYLYFSVCQLRFSIVIGVVQNDLLKNTMMKFHCVVTLNVIYVWIITQILTSAQIWAVEIEKYASISQELHFVTADQDFSTKKTLATEVLIALTMLVNLVPVCFNHFSNLLWVNHVIQPRTDYIHYIFFFSS